MGVRRRRETDFAQLSFNIYFIYFGTIIQLVALAPALSARGKVTK